MGRLISRIGEKFLTIYFWYRPVLYILTGLQVYERLDQMLGWRMGRVAWIFCGVVIVFLLSCICFGKRSKILWMSYGKNTLAHNRCGKERQRFYLKYVAVFSLIFAFTFVLAFFLLLKNGYSLVDKVDGRLQNFTILCYIGRSVRQYIMGVFDGNFVVPMFDLAMGLGEDIISFPGAQGLLDPLVVILSALCPTSSAELLYNFIVVVYIYLAGLSFSFLCFSYEKPWQHTLIGAIIYWLYGRKGHWTVYFFFSSIYTVAVSNTGYKKGF